MSSPWPVTNRVSSPQPGQTHVWSVSLEATATQVADYRSLLSADEVARADRFKLDYLGRRFTVGRGVLRRLLGQYLDANPARLEFAYAAKGKPSLTGPWRETRLRFNVSNSHELALIAVTLDQDLGVDVEHLRPMRDMLGLAERFFAAREVEALRALPDEVQLPAFFRCWTRKEAILKAVGCGLSYPLEKVVVSLDPDDPRVLSMNEDATETNRWQLRMLYPATEYVGALALATSAKIDVAEFAWGGS